ncbi:hypothetical protein SAMN05216389_11634 [Oceanobacillus limi]|uniref:Uncharacterized protein n=1 Tax=Oceanobacillus limi TaxID=930131 RepID=A0A1I0FM67_9BACI|nr:hypothetical protein SAMN05216389_11634 [Oceanobacillus limi]
MVYKASTIKVVQFSFFMLIMLFIFQNKDSYPWTLYYLIPCALVILATVFMNFIFLKWYFNVSNTYFRITYIQ